MHVRLINWNMLQNSAPFTVGVLDYYGNLGVAEHSGSCSIVTNDDNITLAELGRQVDINNGSGSFQQFQITGASFSCLYPLRFQSPQGASKARMLAGGIDESFVLQLSCQPGTGGQNALLPPALDIPDISFPISVAHCLQVRTGYHIMENGFEELLSNVF